MTFWEDYHVNGRWVTGQVCALCNDNVMCAIATQQKMRDRSSHFCGQSFFGVHCLEVYACSLQGRHGRIRIWHLAMALPNYLSFLRWVAQVSFSDDWRPSKGPTLIFAMSCMHLIIMNIEIAINSNNYLFSNKFPSPIPPTDLKSRILNPQNGTHTTWL